MRLYVSSTGPNGAGAGEALRVLFIGNSYTARNNLPARVQRLARAMRRTMAVRLIAAGGASLKRHWNATGTIDTLNEGWDICVLQEQSTLPVRNPAKYFESVRLFDQAIRAAGGRTFLYLPWHRQAEPNRWQPLSGAVLSIAREVDATVVPVGLAWRIALAGAPALPLYANDGSHPTPLGTTLAAFAFAQSLLGALPTLPVDFDDVPLEMQSVLADAARQAVDRMERPLEFA